MSGAVHVSRPKEEPMGQTAAYCSECYNKVARTEDEAVKAAEGEGKVPMTKQGSCSKCSKTTTVVYYE